MSDVLTALDLILCVVVLVQLVILRGRERTLRAEMAFPVRSNGMLKAATADPINREAFLPSVVSYDGRAVEEETVWLGKTVSADGSGVEALTLPRDERLVVLGEGRYAVGRAVTSQWAAAGHPWELLDETGEGLTELWGTGCTEITPRDGVAERLTALDDLVVHRYSLLSTYSVNHIDRLPERVRPQHLFVVLNVGDGQTGADLQAGHEVWGQGGGRSARLGRAAGIHVMLLAGNPWYSQVTPGFNSPYSGRLLLGDTSGGALYQAGMEGATPPANPDLLGRGLYAEPLSTPRLVQAVTAPAHPLPDGWEREDLRLAVSAGLTIAEIESTPLPLNEAQRLTFTMLAGLR